MKRLLTTLFMLLTFTYVQSQSNGKPSEKLDNALQESEMLTQQFFEHISSSFKNGTGENDEIIYPYAPKDSGALTLVDQYYRLMFSLVSDIKIEDLTSKNYLEKLQENSAVKEFHSELFDQITTFKEDFQRDTEAALEGIRKE